MKNKVTILLISILLLNVLCLPLSAATLRRACEFVSSIGINTHFGYTDEPYYSQADSLSKLLGALGVTFIRDGIDDSNWKRTSKIQDSIFRKYGIKMLACVGPRLPGTWPTPLDTTTASTKRLIDTMRVRYGDAILAIEGPNEYDLSHGTAETDWVKALSSYVQMLARVIRADATYSHLPIVAPSLCFGHESQVGDISSFIDFGNTHSYPGGNSPATGLATNIVNAQKTCMTKPIWATETGYHTAINQPAGQGHPGVSEEAQARYIPRLFAEYFRAGIYKTSTYEFLDERDNPANDDMEQHFGLVRFDCSVKPAYMALKNLIAVLRDDTAAFAPASARPMRLSWMKRACGLILVAVFFAPNVSAPVRKARFASQRNIALPLRHGRRWCSAKRNFNWQRRSTKRRANFLAVRSSCAR